MCYRVCIVMYMTALNYNQYLTLSPVSAIGGSKLDKGNRILIVFEKHGVFAVNIETEIM